MLCMLLPAAAIGQGSAAYPDSREAAITRGQQRAGAAYRDLQQAEFEAKLAEQDYANAHEAELAARKVAELRARHTEGAKKALAAAQAKVAAARKRYEAALTGVDQAFGTKPAK